MAPKVEELRDVERTNLAVEIVNMLVKAINRK